MEAINKSAHALPMTQRPESCGIAIPCSAAELLKIIQKQADRTTSTHKPNDGSRISDRLRKQDAEREELEKKLMSFEDYTFKAEGAERLSRNLERMRM